jgi:hypothetical protein
MQISKFLKAWLAIAWVVPFLCILMSSFDLKYIVSNIKYVNKYFPYKYCEESSRGQCSIYLKLYLSIFRNIKQQELKLISISTLQDIQTSFSVIAFEIKQIIKSEGISDKIDDEFHQIISKSISIILDTFNDILKPELNGIIHFHEIITSNFIDTQYHQITQITQAAQNALGMATDVAMVRTFSQETTMQRCVHGFMFCLSIGILGLMLWLGFDTIKLITNPSIMNNKVSEIVKVKDGKISNAKMSNNDSVDITLLIMRGLLFIPLGLGFWMANKKSDKAALLSAEYRHKKAVVEAMLGYRATYQSSNDQFSDGFKREYEKFFNATFAEINRNPADKINKMIKENNFKIEDIKDLIKIIKSKD